jgi:predicted GIY-YIG superfamily endonuclease
MVFWVYMLRCGDGSYYVGHTDNLEARIAQHVAGTLPGYTHKRRPVTLVYSEEAPSRLEALTFERRIKGWSRAKKEALIDRDGIELRLSQGEASCAPNSSPPTPFETPAARAPQGERRFSKSHRFCTYPGMR